MDANASASVGQSTQRGLPVGGGRKLRKAFFSMSALLAVLLVFLTSILYAASDTGRQGNSFVLPPLVAIVGGLVALTLMIAGGTLAGVSGFDGDFALFAPLVRAGWLVRIGQIVVVAAIVATFVSGFLTDHFLLGVGFSALDLSVAFGGSLVGKLIRRTMGYP